jgi:orotidine-5'-phosphate decarboxylase
MPLIIKDIPARERLIFALDVADPEAARELANRLGDAVQFYKIGLELCMSRGFFDLLDWLVARGKRVFVDLKFFDVPATVQAAVGQLRNRGVTLTTVHGNQDHGSRLGREGDVKVSQSLYSRVRSQISTTSDSTATSRSSCCHAPRARGGLRRRWSLGLEARCCASFDHRLLVVTPGSGPSRTSRRRPEGTVGAAFTNGADYIVVGRPIRDVAIRAVAESIQSIIADLFERDVAVDTGARERPLLRAQARRRPAPGLDRRQAGRHLPEIEDAAVLGLLHHPELRARSRCSRSSASRRWRSCSRTS